MALQRMGHAGAAAGTSLTAGMTPADSSFTIASGAGWPTGASGRPFVAVVDPNQPGEEKILCASLTGTTVNVASGGRGWDGTAATSHTAGAVVEHVLAAVEVDDDNDHIYTVARDDHSQYARADGTRPITGPQTFQAGITDTGTFDQTGLSHLRGNTDITGTLSASGLTTLSSGLAVTGATTLTGTLHATSDATLDANLTVAGNATADTLAATGLAGAASPSRYVGSTAAGPPTSGTFALGDFVVDQLGVLYTCIAAGTPGTWSVPVGGLVGSARGPASVIDALNNQTPTVLSLTVALRAGRTYLVHARHQGSVVTASPNFVNTNLSDTAGLIIGQPHYLISLSMDAYYVGNIMGGGLTSLLLPAGNLSDTITMKTGGGSTGGGAWRTPINGAEIMVVRVA